MSERLGVPPSHTPSGRQDGGQVGLGAGPNSYLLLWDCLVAIAVRTFHGHCTMEVWVIVLEACLLVLGVQLAF